MYILPWTSKYDKKIVHFYKIKFLWDTILKNEPNAYIYSSNILYLFACHVHFVDSFIKEFSNNSNNWMKSSIF